MNTEQMLAVVAVLLGLSGRAVAGIINVPSDELTIQAGINAAVNGDEVVVAPGTYFETIDFLGKAITVRSSGGAFEETTDGMEVGNVSGVIETDFGYHIIKRTE